MEHQSEQHDREREPERATPERARRAWLAGLTVLLLFPLLLFPGHPERFTVASFLVLPLEWPLLILALSFAQGGMRRALRLGVVLLIGVVVLLRIADIGSYIAFDRRFSPLVEWHLIGDGWNLASASVGTGEALVALTLALLLTVGACVALYRGLGAIAVLRAPWRRPLRGIAFALLMVGVVGLIIERTSDIDAPVQASLLPELIDRSKDMQRSIADQSAFLAELAVDPVEAGAPPRFEALDGRDLLVFFVESYGRSFIDDPDLGLVADTRLTAVGDAIEAAGLYSKSAWLESPIRGGRSWLAHATFASGLTISNQARFDRLIASERRSLYRLLGDADFRTFGLNPAIVQAWPEGAWYGYEHNLTFDDLGYAGQNVGWVTMPDQYTLSHFQRELRVPSDDPVAAELALISSHAPWTPLSTLVPWEDIGDGSIFDGSHRFGGKPVWSDRQKVRELYAQSLDYTLAAIGEWLERYGENALVLVVGDHQPASIIAGWGRTADVPVHAITDDPALLERLPDDWFVPGMVPPPGLASRPMASMRAFLAGAFERD